ncbi:MAG: HNH endonuclease [Pyrinomonadaceae bacterium]
MTRTQKFSMGTQQLALVRQKFQCASCGTCITRLGEPGRSEHAFGEIAHAHHIRHIKFGGTNSLDNCAVLCQACHYSAHEGGNYRHGTVVGRPEDFPHFNG